MTKGYTGTVQLHFYHLGNNHHLCSGAATVLSHVDFPVYGNAKIVGGQIYLTYSGAGIRNGIIGHDLTKAILNPDTMGGTVTAIEVYWDDTAPEGTAIIELTDSGTFTP